MDGNIDQMMALYLLDLPLSYRAFYDSINQG